MVTNNINEVTDGVAGVSVTWNVRSWSRGHEFKPRLGWTWGAWYFCPKSYLYQTYVYSLICHRVQHTSQFTPLVLELSLLCGLMSSGEISAHFLQLMPFTILHFRSTRYPSLLGGQRWHDMIGLCSTFTHGQQCDLSTGHPSKW